MPANHDQETGEMAAFEDDTKVKVSAITRGYGGIPETMVSLRSKEWIEVQISK